MDSIISLCVRKVFAVGWPLRRDSRGEYFCAAAILAEQTLRTDQVCNVDFLNICIFDFE